jgi:acyl dehydratase
MTRNIKPEDLPGMVGMTLEPSPWMEIDQQRVDRFADATDDHQFIHIDPDRARLTPFGGTIAHGFLTLSLLIALCSHDSLEPEGTVMHINYGSDKVQFIEPVRVGSRIRAQQTVMEAQEKSPGRWLVKTGVKIEIEGNEKPAMIMEMLSMYIIEQNTTSS